MSYPTHNFAPVAKKFEPIYQRRLDIFTAHSEFKEHNLPKVLEYDRRHEGHVKLEALAIDGVQSRPLFADALKQGEFKVAQKGERFGPSWATHWFKVQIQVPKEWASAQDVLFNWDCGNEALVFTEDGRVVVGLSGEERREWLLPKQYRDGNWHTFFIEVACNGMFGNADPSYNIQPPIEDRYFTLQNADLVWPNTEARALKADFEVIRDAVKNFAESSWQKHRGLEIASKIMDVFDPKDLTSIGKCRELAKEFLGDKVDSEKVFEGGDQNALVFAVGHCHIDTAWLWPYGETRRKIGRSWATQLDLIERYPEYTFVCSQAVQYAWLKEDYPELFERLKVQVKKGRFIPVGGSWVENDGNLPSGEAVARQFLYGQRFFEANFGSRCHNFWLPDTFGYAGQLPQLCRESDIKSFLTQKLSWNLLTNFPHTTFNWAGLDGSQVLCHMPPSDTYNSVGDITEIQKSVTTHKNSGVDQSSMLLFGFGDGGGGPTVEMLERIRRARGLADTVGNLPQVHMGGDVESYFERLAKKTDNGTKLASWMGELYFEFHRGTYTTQAETKRGNRECEVLLHDLEYFCALLSATSDYKYPKQEIDQMWELLLLNQFHDVLPGSSIELVYKDAEAYYNQIREVGAKVIDQALASVSTGDELVALNTLPWARSELVKLDGDVSGVSQKSANGSNYARFAGNGVMKQVQAGPQASVTATEQDGAIVLDNAKLRVTIKDSVITSVYDYTNKREIVSKGANAHQYCIFDDQPLNWQGWETELYSLDKRTNVAPGTAKIIEQGPLRAAVLIEQQISEVSWVKTTVSLDAHFEDSGLPIVRFDSEVEWREACKFLKVEFPVDVHNDFATYDTMYGSVKRPTHYNTTQDVAKFEVCCHKYADLSDYSYGVSIINNNKYGFATHGNVMRLSLLRAAKAPDANADMGRHHISYALVGHTGGVGADTMRLAQNFNHPLRVCKANTDLFDDAITYQGPSNVLLSAVKRAEDDSDVSTGALPVRNKGKSIVVRLNDTLGGKAPCGAIVTKLPITKAYKTNLLEDDKHEVPVRTENGKSVIDVEVGAFEIASYRLQL